MSFLRISSTILTPVVGVGSVGFGDSGAVGLEVDGPASELLFLTSAIETIIARKNKIKMPWHYHWM